MSYRAKSAKIFNTIEPRVDEWFPITSKTNLKCKNTQQTLEINLIKCILTFIILTLLLNIEADTINIPFLIFIINISQ